MAALRRRAAPKRRTTVTPRPAVKRTAKNLPRVLKGRRPTSRLWRGDTR